MSQISKYPSVETILDCIYIDIDIISIFFLGGGGLILLLLGVGLFELYGEVRGEEKEGG